jgi:hypothetical protein
MSGKGVAFHIPPAYTDANRGEGNEWEYKRL